MIGDMTEQDRLMAYRMTVLLPPPEGIYKDDRTLTDEQRKEFMEIDNLKDAHIYYTLWSSKNYTDEFKNILKEVGY